MTKDFRKNPGGEEKRIHPRRKILTKISYRELVSSGEEGLIRDISDGGLCLLLNKKFSPGSILEVKYELRGKTSRPTEAIVKIVWQKKTDTGWLTGVKFIA